MAVYYECCDHCEHDINDPLHDTPCAEGCNATYDDDLPEYDPYDAAAAQAEDHAAAQAEPSAIEAEEAQGRA